MCVYVMSGRKVVRHKKGKERKKFMHIYYVVICLKVGLEKKTYYNEAEKPTEL